MRQHQLRNQLIILLEIKPEITSNQIYQFNSLRLRQPIYSYTISK